MATQGFSITERDEILDARRYYVPDNGVTDATEQLQALLNTGRSVRLKRGGTYLVSATLTLQEGQTLYGNGATIKRAAQVSTTTAQSIVSGSTHSLAVANVSGFRVGMSINCLNGSTYDTSNRTISAIQGNVLILSTSLGITVSGTTSVYSSWNTIDATADYCRVYDLAIDGNKSNFTFYRWEVTKELMFGGDRSLFQGVRIANAPGEAFISTGTGDHVNFRDCWVTSANGNGFHLSGNTNTTIDGCSVVTCNIDTAVGHADGCISVSDSVTGLKVRGCYLSGGISGVGGIDSSDNLDITIVDNEIRSCTSSAIEGSCPQTDPSNVVITGNRIYDSVLVVWNNTNGTPTVYPSRFIFSSNYLQNTKIQLYRCKYVTITDNIIEDSGDTTALEIELQGVSYAVIKGNTITGGDRAVWIEGAATDGVLVTENILINQNRNAVRTETASMLNVLVTNNVISNDSTANAAYDGIRVNTGVMASGNRLTLVKGNAGLNLLNGSLANGNFVTGSGSGPTYGYRASGGTTGIFAEYNYYSGTFGTAGESNGGGGSNTFTNNRSV